MTLKFWDMKNFENFKFELFSQGTYDSQNLRYETQVIADYEYVKISRIAVMDIKLWMKKRSWFTHRSTLMFIFKFIDQNRKNYAKYFLILAITLSQT